MLNSPGIWSDTQVAAWKEVTSAVHAKGGRIFCQLWNFGRAAHPGALAKAGHSLKAPSAIPFAAGGAVPEPLTEEDIQLHIADYVQAAYNAVHRAGFDGVEIHGANGYLLDQFLQDISNQRTDKWGGSIENRARLGLEVARAIIDTVGADRTAYRLSPFSDFQGMGMADPVPQFEYMARELSKLKLAYLHVVEARISGNQDSECGEGRNVGFLVRAWDNTSPVLLAGGFTSEKARATVDETYKNYDVAIVFGRFFISNPDLVFRVQEGIPLTMYDRALFYITMSSRGYTDYPFSEEFKAQAESAQISAVG